MKRYFTILISFITLLLVGFVVANPASAAPIDHRDSNHPWCLSVPFTHYVTDFTPNELCYGSRDVWVSARDSYPYLYGYDHGTLNNQDYAPDGTPAGTLAWVGGSSCNSTNHYMPTMPPGWNDYALSAQTAQDATGCSNFYHWDNYNYTGTRRNCGYQNPCNSFLGDIQTSSEQFVSNIM